MPDFTLQKLAAYNNWANSKLLKYFKLLNNQVPAESLQLFSHVLNAQIIRLCRIQSVPAQVTVWQIHTLAEMPAFCNSTSVRLEELVQLELNQLKETIPYTNPQGEAFTSSLHDILIHILNHGTYHRAQIARDLRQNNLTPPNTDYINFVREQLKENI